MRIDPIFRSVRTNGAVGPTLAPTGSYGDRDASRAQISLFNAIAVTDNTALFALSIRVEGHGMSFDEYRLRDERSAASRDEMGSKFMKMRKTAKNARS